MSLFLDFVFGVIVGIGVISIFKLALLILGMVKG